MGYRKQCVKTFFTQLVVVKDCKQDLNAFFTMSLRNRKFEIKRIKFENKKEEEKETIENNIIEGI